jgi:colanic acid/amylovoran biosynthesis glycosyltransferase
METAGREPIMPDAPLRIALIVHQFPAVSETFVLNHITGLLDRGHEVEIFARDGGSQAPRHEAVDRYELDSRTTYWGMPEGRLRRLWAAGELVAGPLGLRGALEALNPVRYGAEALSLAQLFRSARVTGRGPYDIVHAHFGPNGRLAVRLREAGRIAGAVVTTFHGYDLTQWLNRRGAGYYRPLFERGELMLPVSHRLGQELVRAGCRPEKVLVHHMGISCRRIERRAWHGWPRDEVRLITVARLVEKKGVELGVEAVAGLAGRYPGLRYTIIGDGPLRSMLERLVATRGVGHVIKLAGWMTQAETLSEIARSDLMLAPSRTPPSGDEEGIPVVLMEAMAVGVPVLSTRHGGIPELVHDNVSGRLVNEGNVDALTMALRELLDRREVWPDMGRRGRSVIEADFDLDHLNDRLVEIYREVSSKR